MSKQRLYYVDYTINNHKFELAAGYTGYIDNSGNGMRQVVCELFREHFGHAAKQCGRISDVFFANDDNGNEIAISQLNHGTPHHKDEVNRWLSIPEKINQILSGESADLLLNMPSLVLKTAQEAQHV